MLSILFGLASALSWGAGDFTGGLASRKTGAYRTVFYGEIVGLILLLIAAAFRREVPSTELLPWVLACISGGIGTIGLLLLYQAMAEGKMSIAAPVSALLAAALPVAVGLFTEGLPKPSVFAGFGFALAAVWLVTRSDGDMKDLLTHITDLRLPLMAGIGFGLYFVLMHAATRTSTLWPMIASRSAGLAVMGLFILVRREAWRVPRPAWPVITANGTLDVGGNLFYILAGQAGRMDISAVLSSLFPGATVLLASIFLKERLTRTQWVGILAALIAIVLFTL